jgi:hypothetical protein
MCKRRPCLPFDDKKEQVKSHQREEVRGRGKQSAKILRVGEDDSKAIKVHAKQLSLYRFWLNLTNLRLNSNYGKRVNEEEFVIEQEMIVRRGVIR